MCRSVDLRVRQCAHQHPLRERADRDWMKLRRAPPEAGVKESWTSPRLCVLLLCLLIAVYHEHDAARHASAHAGAQLHDATQVGTERTSGRLNVLPIMRQARPLPDSMKCNTNYNYSYTVNEVRSMITGVTSR